MGRYGGMSDRIDRHRRWARRPSESEYRVRLIRTPEGWVPEIGLMPLSPWRLHSETKRLAGEPRSEEAPP
jgi:hypothetical protein